MTGASKGIGHAISLKLSPTYRVVGLSRTIADGVETITTDITSQDDVQRAFEEIYDRYGCPSVLVNCAGYVEPQGILELTMEEWNRTIATNLTGVFLCTRQFVRYAKNVGGIIVNISSTAGMRPQPGWAAYAASKAGVINFSLTMSEELHDYGIRVFCIAPGRCATDLRKKLAPDEDQSAIMKPGEVADVVEMLIRYGQLLDGQVIRVRRK